MTRKQIAAEEKGEAPTFNEWFDSEEADEAKRDAIEVAAEYMRGRLENKDNRSEAMKLMFHSLELDHEKAVEKWHERNS